MMSSRRKQSNPRSLKDVDDAPDKPTNFEMESNAEISSTKGETCTGDIEATAEPDAPAHPDAPGQNSQQLSNSLQQTNSGDEGSDIDVDTPINQSGPAGVEFPYPCSSCDKSFSKLSYVRDHELVHSAEMPYQCDFCQRPFRHKRSRDRHMKLHTGDKSYKCSLCEAAFSRSDHLKNHMKSHSNGKWLPPVHPAAKPADYCTSQSTTDNDYDIQSSKANVGHKCQLCRKTFSNYYELDEHVKSHESATSVLPTKPLEYHCTHCAKQSLKQVFASLPALEQHVTHMHTGKGLSLLSCPHCQDAFPTVPMLNEHIEREHPKTSRSTAESTAASTSKISSQHQSTFHDTVSHASSDGIVPSDIGRHGNSKTTSETMACNVCKKSFTTSAELISHIFTDHGTQSIRPTNPSRTDPEARDSSTPLDLSSRSPSTSPVVCHICGDSLGSLQQLVEHNQTKHWEMPKSKCNVCSEVVSSPHQHLDHMEQHYLSTRRHYLCRCCKQSFSLVDELQNHLITEHSRKIYNCLLCSDMFHTEVDLKIHLTVEHSNETKTYKCACCGHDFEEIAMWRAHMLQAHIDLVLPKAGVGLNNAKKEQLLQCPYCVKSFRTEAEINLHILSHQKSFQCSLCDEKFAVEYLRDKHIQNEHSRQQHADSCHKPVSVIQGSSSESSSPFVCSICDRVFHSEDVYEEHKRKSHSSVKSWHNRPQDKSSVSSSAAIHPKMFSTACDTCGKAFKTYSELDKHSRVHFGPVSLTCVICDQVCSNLSDMAKHKLQHCKMPSTRPCILCHTDVKDLEAYMKHSHSHIEPDSTIICCVCKHRVTSQVELELHAEFHFPKNSSLSCASCKKACPYFIQLPAQLTENPQFLLCQECLMARKQATNIVVPGRMLPVPPLPSDARSPPAHLPANSCSPRSFSRDQKASLGSIHSSSPPIALHRCNECSVKYESLEELQNHACMHKTCINCQKLFKISELVCKLDSYICSSCDSVPKDLWKCDKCKLTFTREEKYQKHNCIALGDGKACNLCQGRFNHSQLLLRGNKLVCKGCDQKLMTCRICSEVYKHNEGHRCRLRCENCHEMFTVTKQVLGKPTLCKLCIDKQAESVFDSHNRSRVSLPSDKVYQCIKCQKTCESENEIKIHILTYHANEKNHKCCLCGNQFSTPAKLQIHLIEHNFGFSDRMTCPKCDWSTSDASSLIGHCTSEHSVTNRSFVCKFCLQSFFFETELANHSSTHHSNSVGGCNLSTTRGIEQLSSRKRSYSDEKGSILLPRVKMIKSEAFSDNDDSDELFCSKCDMEFVSVEQYSTHLNLHHRDTLVNCSWCARLYCCQDDLKEHMSLCLREKSRRQSDEVFTNCIPNGRVPTFNRGNSDASTASTASYSSRLQSHCSSPQNCSNRSKASNSDIDETAEPNYKPEPLVY